MTDDIKTSDPRKAKQVGVRFPNGNIYMVPEGVSPAQFAAWNGLTLARKSSDKKPPPGVPHQSELDVKFADDDDLSDNSGTVIYESGKGGVIPTVASSSGKSAIPSLDAPSAIPTASSGFEQPVDLTPWREVVRKHGNIFLGKLKLIKRNGVNYVRTEELEALVSKTNSRGSRKREKNPDSASEKISKAVADATARRKQAFEARQRAIQTHEEQQQREYRPR